MQCRYCAGEEPDKIYPFKTAARLKGITGEMLAYEYRGNVERAYQVFGWGGVRAGGAVDREIIGCVAHQTQRLTHIKSSAVIEIHDCFERDTFLFKAVGVAPQTAQEIEVFADFFRQVIRDREPRGRKGAVTIDQVVDKLCEMMRRGEDPWTPRVAAELSISVRRLQEVMKPAGGIKGLKRIAKTRK